MRGDIFRRFILYFQQFRFPYFFSIVSKEQFIMKTLLRVLFTLIIAAGLLAPQATVFAQDTIPDCRPGIPAEICAAMAEQDGGVAAQASANFKPYYSKTLNGGYVAHGVAMRNLGYGTITVDDVPAGAKVVKAYLFWSLMAPPKMTGFYYNKGKINGLSVTGSLVGTAANPSWPVAYYGAVPVMAYRADVTGKVNKAGNGTYQLTGFASAVTDGSDPNLAQPIAPALDGATLVIIYSKSNYPKTTIKIYNGAVTIGNEHAQNVHLAVTGLKATGITGLSQTTFIGADGYNTSGEGPVTKFFETELPDIEWKGLSVPDGQGEYSPSGNTWDTATADLTHFIEPPENDFWFTISHSGMPFVWEAQVVSYATGSQDTDGDKLPDGWELHGVNGLDLPGFGADPLHKDLFVEADYMTDIGHDHLLDYVHLQDIVNVFAAAPVSNPDGTNGVNIHIDTGGAAYGDPAGTYPEFNLGGGNGVPEDMTLGADTYYGDYDWTQFQEYKDAYFARNRYGIFHYMIFAHDLTENEDWWGISGISRNGWPDKTFAKGAMDFIVSMGSWDLMGTQSEREGTFIHELGHNLGLRHGGNDHVNYKPNYLSIMNYMYQTAGIWRDGSVYYDYSRVAPTLNEAKLSETKGLGSSASGYGVMWFCPPQDPKKPWLRARDSSVTTEVDWNCNGTIEIGSKRVDVNFDYRFTTLKSQNNWASITFAGGGKAGTLPDLGVSASALMTTKPTGCLTYEDAQEIEAHSFFEVP